MIDFRWPRGLVVILIPKILRYSFIQAQCRQAQGRLRSAATASLAVERKSELKVLYKQYLRHVSNRGGRVAISCKSMSKSCKKLQNLYKMLPNV